MDVISEEMADDARACTPDAMIIKNFLVFFMKYLTPDMERAASIGNTSSRTRATAMAGPYAIT